jgi:hypothetical protein
LRHVTTLTAAAVCALTMTAPTSATAQITAGETFDWSGRLPPGATLRVYSVDGSITVSRASGDQVVVHGQRGRTYDDSWHHRRQEDQSGPRAIAFERVQDGDNVTICAYEQGDGSCDIHGVRGRNRDQSWGPHWSADFTVQLPADIKVALGTGDGEVMVRGAGSEVSASTGDGDITIDQTSGPVRASSGDGKIVVSAAAGPVDASTGDGNIEVRMASVPHPGDMHFRTGDGSVTIYLPSTFAGELDAHTGDGQIESDFPLEINGRLEASHVRASIGGGGLARITVSTGDGDVRLRKAGAP